MAATPEPALDDEALMRAFGAGNAQAFEQLYARHQAALYRFVRRLLGHGAAAQVDEVFQDTWLRAVQTRHSWQAQHTSGASFRTWLFTLAHNRAVDCQRKLGREVSSDAAEGDAVEPWAPTAATETAAWSQWPNPQVTDEQENRLFWRRAGEKLLDCLESLPLAQKSAFLLQHEDDLGVDDIARALGVGFETAKTRLRYAMSKLRTCMGAYLPGKTGA
jgi:RNA polymerase sigma factor (sigma-70 family)